MNYDGVALDCAYRLDMVVNELVVVELKAIERFAPIHTAQMITYLKLTGLPVGLLINFNVRVLKDGIKRVINRDRAPGRRSDLVRALNFSALSVLSAVLLCLSQTSSVTQLAAKLISPTKLYVPAY